MPTAVVAAIVAARDVRVLGDRGFAGLPSPLLALVSPVLYLWVRARRCERLDRDTWSPVRWAIGTTVAAIVLVLVGVGFQAAIAPLFTPPEG